MDQHLDQILAELGVDPRDEATVSFVKQMIASRPKAELNPAFVARLRQQLMARAQTAQKPSIINSLFSTFMKRAIVSFAVVVVVVLAAGGYLLSRQGKLPGTSGTAQQILSAKYAVSDAPANAFGSLASLTAATGQGGNNLSGDAKLAAPNTVSTPEDGFGVGGGGTPDPIVVPPYTPEVYSFKYEGQALEDLPSQQPVFRRNKENSSTGLIDRIIKTITLGLIDLSKFDNAKLQQFSITEDQEFGYSVNVDVTNGYVNLYQNWEKWPRPQDNCRDEACYRQFQLKPEDIPADDVIISIADQFIADKGISRDGYGDPVVVNYWRDQYRLLPAVDRANYYVPDMIDVVYPLQLNGESVYDEGGNESGMHLSVDIRNRRVASVYELMTKQFQKSGYTGETDSSRIIKLAEQGGFRSYFPPLGSVPDAKVVEFQLDTPKTVMLRMWKYDGNKSEEMYVPALVFPIKNPSAQFWRKNVIVPLVKEVLDSEPQQQVPIPVDLQKSLPPATEPARAN